MSIDKVWNIDSYFAALPSLKPVRGVISAKHQGNTLYVKGEIETILSFRCDRCFETYNQSLFFNGEELIWIGEKAPNDLMESIEPLGVFHPEQWAFEQLSLQIPLQKNCGSGCKSFYSSREYESGTFLKSNLEEENNPQDPRWEKLKKLL